MRVVRVFCRAVSWHCVHAAGTHMCIRYFIAFSAGSRLFDMVLAVPILLAWEVRDSADVSCHGSLMR